MIHTHTHKLTVIFSLMLLMSCNIIDSDSKSSACGPGIIIPGECIEGVKLGDSREQVEKLIGEPGNVGWAHGLYRVWRTYSYSPPETRTPSLFISFLYYGEDLPWGPVDMIHTLKPYLGKTPEGFGMGSALDEVLKAYGEPVYSQEGLVGDGDIQGNYIWCYGTTKFTVSTLNDTVEGFFMGHHFSFSDEEVQDYQCSD